MAGFEVIIYGRFWVITEDAWWHVGSTTPVHLPGNRRSAKEGANAAMEPASSAHYACRMFNGT
jgi:hypothetical protein